MNRVIRGKPLRYILLAVAFSVMPVWGGPQTLIAVADQPAVPDFVLPDIDGNTHRLSDYRGKVVIINFWATWCPPCRREMPSMERAWQSIQSKNVLMLAINVGQNEDQVWEFTAETPVTFPMLLDESGRVSDEWPMLGLPTTFVVDREGRVVYRAVGDREWDDPELLAPIISLSQ